MSWSRRTMVLVGLAVALAAVVFVFRVRVWPQAGSCAIDDGIPAGDREVVGRAALYYVDAILGLQPSDTYELFTSEAAASQTRQQFASIAETTRKRIGTPQNIRIAHTYLISLLVGDHQRVVCGDVSRRESWVAVETTSAPRQAYVLVDVATDHQTYSFVLWLIPEREQWRVQHAYSGPSDYMGRSPEDFESLAQVEEQEHRSFNAYELYLESLALAERGPSFQLGILPRIREGIRKVQLSGPLGGAAPYKWVVGDAEFKIMSIYPIGLSDRRNEDKIFLNVFHEIDPWVDDAFAERRNRQLIAAFAATYPEYKRAFAGLVIKAQEKPHGTTYAIWGTVAEND